MKIKVLGCSGAEYQVHTPLCFMLDKKTLFDAGNLTNSLSDREQSRIENVFVTHSHLDHVNDIPFIADDIVISKRNQRLKIMGIEPVINAISKNIFNDIIWPDFSRIPDRHNAVLSYVTLKEGVPFMIDNYEITPYRVRHSVPATGYLIKRDKRSVFYTGDTGPTDYTWRKIGSIQINTLIIEVSFPNNMTELAIRVGHMTPKLLIKELSKIRFMPERIYITHLKHRHSKMIKNELNSLGIRNIRLLKGGETIKI